MFLPPKRTAIVVAFTLLLTPAVDLFGQSSEYERRLAAMHQARGRAEEPYREYDSGAMRVSQNTQPVRTASATSNPVPQRTMPAPQSASRSMNSMGSMNSGSVRMARAPQPSNRPGTMRVAQLHEQPMSAGGSPVIDQGVYEGVIEDGGYYEDQGHFAGDINTCGSECGYFDCGPCANQGLCPPGDCWLQGLGAVLYRGDYFFGAQGFSSPMYGVAGTDQLFQDCNFGFYGGFNWGMPLCRLSCGLFAGQFGIRSVQTNFGGNAFTPDNREQLFMTAGLFRRVDYGFQGGVVADILWDNWFTNSNVVQIRTDLGYLWAGGTSFGFRYHGNVREDNTSGVIGGLVVNDILTTSEDSFRFYLRHEANFGGFGEVFVGWTDSEQTILGGQIDVPITHLLATQAGVTYYMDDTLPPTSSGRLGGYVNEAWNVYAGFSFRPCGRSYYRNYDRPFFDVADNGSMLIRRQ